MYPYCSICLQIRNDLPNGKLRVTESSSCEYTDCNATAEPSTAGPSQQPQAPGPAVKSVRALNRGQNSGNFPRLQEIEVEREPEN
jgi:hypothetical protein